MNAAKLRMHTESCPTVARGLTWPLIAELGSVTAAVAYLRLCHVYGIGVES